MKILEKKSMSASIINEAKRITISQEEYDKLENIKSNRPFSDKIYKKMAESVFRYGCLRDLIVYWDSVKKKYVIIDGQHLFKVLMYFELPIHCKVVQVEKGELTKLMTYINNINKGWSLNDYIHSWAENGNHFYKIVQKTLEKYSVQESVILMAYTFTTRAKATKLCKDGTLEITNRDKSEKLLSYLTDTHEFLPNNRVYNEAIMKLIIKLSSTDNYDNTRMLRNLNTHAKKTNFSVNESEIYKQLVNIYNK